MELCLITDKTDFASEAERAGVERIMLDLEIQGKSERQIGEDLFISNHVIECAPRMRAALKHAALVVRVNPMNANSGKEIEAVKAAGADFIMLPYFHTIEEVLSFLSLVGVGAKAILLVETKSALEILPILARERIGDEIHIGLNDLRISLGHQTIFEPLCDGTLENVSVLLREEGIPFGFGGIARLSHCGLPVNPETVLAEQVRLGASVGWLGRTFRGQMENSRRTGELANELNLIRRSIEKWRNASPGAFAENRKALIDQVAEWGLSQSR